MAREVSCEEKSTAFVYSDVSSDQKVQMNQIQGFESNSTEIFNLATGMENMIEGFSKNLQTDNLAIWSRSFFNKSGVEDSLQKPIDDQSTTSDHQFYQHELIPDFTTGISDTSSDHQNQIQNQNLMAEVHEEEEDDDHQTTTSTWEDQNRSMLVDDSSLRCVFPCEGNERPSQGLSLSLSSTNPNSIGLQAFELRQTHQWTNSRDGYFGKPINIQQNMNMDMSMGMDIFHEQGHQFVRRNSKYLVAAQEILNEFCFLGNKQSNDLTKQKPQKGKWNDDQSTPTSSSSRSKQPFDQFMEFQKRKTKLVSMLEEVDRRYRHYCDQMKAVVCSFEAVAGNGTASVYSALASKAMSRHFRSLRDGIVSQIHATKQAMGEKDPVAPGTTKGETPRLKMLDQALRQQRAYQQMNMMETHPWRPQRGLPERSVSILRAWLFEHFLHPYPSDVDKHILARQTGLSRSQVSNWFINARVRLWKPMVEEMYVEEVKEQDNNNTTSSDRMISNADHDRGNANRRPVDQKPTPEQLIRIDSECLSSIINNNSSQKNMNPKTTTNTMQNNLINNHHLHHHHNQHTTSFEAYGAMELDFSSYEQIEDGSIGVPYGSTHQNFNRGDVSLTLGLQQHGGGGGCGGGGGGGGGVSLGFSSTSQSPSTLFYRDDHMEDCQEVQYSLLDSDQEQHLPYRNLMGAQLLHDLAR